MEEEECIQQLACTALTEYVYNYVLSGMIQSTHTFCNNLLSWLWHQQTPHNFLMRTINVTIHHDLMQLGYGVIEESIWSWLLLSMTPIIHYVKGCCLLLMTWQPQKLW